MEIILGTLNFDYSSVSERFDDAKIKTMLDLAKSNGINTLDTAYYYNNTETLIGRTQLCSEFNINSKANPWKDNNFSSGKMGSLNSIGVKNQINNSLNALNIYCLDTYFLHAWDYETPILETLEVFDYLYRQDKYKHFGVCNISKEQLQEILEKCENHQLISPEVYQGMYNLYCRNIEGLVSTTREYNIKIQAYNPLAGGILTGKHSNFVESGRFRDNDIYKNIFWKEEVVKNTENLTADMSLRWLRHNSYLTESDSIIIGCSSLQHLISNVNSIKHGSPLNTAEMNIISTFYDRCHLYQPNFFY